MKRITTALATGAFVIGSSLAIAQAPQPQPQPSPRPQTEQPRTGDPQAGKQGAMGEVVLEGCLARDDASASAGAQTTPGGQTTPGAAKAAAGAGQTFLLRNAKRSDASGAGAAPGAGAAGAKGATSPQEGAAKQGQSAQGAMGAGETYRLVAGANVNLSEHVGHQIEVRGRLTGGAQGSPYGGQAKQGGQTQAAGQTAQPGQSGQAGQAGKEAGKQAPGASALGDQYQTVTVSSVKMISQTCTTSR